MANIYVWKQPHLPYRSKYTNIVTYYVNVQYQTSRDHSITDQKNNQDSSQKG